MCLRLSQAAQKVLLTSNYLASHNCLTAIAITAEKMILTSLYRATLGLWTGLPYVLSLLGKILIFQVFRITPIFR